MVFKPSRGVERLSGSIRDLTDQMPKPRTARVVPLNMGDPSFDTPEYVVQAAFQAVRDGYTHYPPKRGDVQLREAVAAYQSRISGVPVSPAEVVITAGGGGAIYAAMMAVLNEGDEVILLDPTYPVYADVALMVGARVVSIPFTSSQGVDVEAIRRAVTPRTRMLVLNFPSNPMGRLLRQEELDELAAIATEHDLVVLSDEVYDQLVFKGRHISVLGHPALTERTILVNSFSKTYAMTGWRVGWVAAKGALLKPIWTVYWTTVAHVSSIAQRAALAALTNEEEDRKWRAWMLKEYEARRKAMWEQLSQVPGVQMNEPEAAFYAWVRYDAPLSSVEMLKFLYERGLSVRPGTEFGATGEGHLRFTFAPSVEYITEGVAIFKAAMEELRS